MPGKLKGGVYLNDSSTKAGSTSILNPSDPYSEVLKLHDNFDNFKRDIIRLVGASPSSKVIINSGATESIANCISWGKHYNPYGNVVGTLYDHSTIEANANNQNMKYIKSYSLKDFSDNPSVIFLTHVNPTTGEILDIDTFTNNYTERVHFLSDDTSLELDGYDPRSIVQQRPIIVLDVTQSILKIPIKMHAWKINACFFSLHKLGGPMGLGVMVISDTKFQPFVPLIAGTQQQGLRGGTMPIIPAIESIDLLKHHDNIESRKKTWNKTMTKLEGAGVKVYRPTSNHLYNTILITTDECGSKVVNNLANHGIYIGTSTACASGLSGGSTSSLDKSKNAVRISFTDPDIITDDVIEKLIKYLA